MDGQYSGTLLADESWKKLEGVCGKSSPEDHNNNREAQFFLEILPNRQEHSRPRK